MLNRTIYRFILMVGLHNLSNSKSVELHLCIMLMIACDVHCCGEFGCAWIGSVVHVMMCAS